MIPSFVGLGVEAEIMPLRAPPRVSLKPGKSGMMKCRTFADHLTRSPARRLLSVRCAPL